MTRAQSVALVAALILGCIACTQHGLRDPTGSMPAAAAIRTDDCDARGGALERRGLLDAWVCVVRYPDAGRICAAKQECQGLCLTADGGQPGDAAIGKCQADSTRFGCYAEIDSGRIVTPFLCMD